MRVPEAAQALGMSVSGVRTRLERGQMQGKRVGPRLWLIPRDEVERWKTLGRQKTGPKRKVQEG
ncbi:MAG: helix-turn-helix domain-containing protein [Dehalococcoidia bacterium]